MRRRRSRVASAGNMAGHVVHAPRPLRPVTPRITLPLDRLVTGPQSPQQLSPSELLQESVAALHAVAPSMIVEAIPACIRLGEAISPSQLMPASPRRVDANPFAALLQPLEANGLPAVAVSASAQPTATTAAAAEVKATAGLKATAGVKAARNGKAGSRPRWFADEEQKLAQLAAQHGFKKKDWGDKAVTLGTGRTAASVEQHWRIMVRKQQAAASTAGGDASEEAATDTLIEIACGNLDPADPVDVLDGCAVPLGPKPKRQRSRAREKKQRWLVWEEDFLTSLVKDGGTKKKDWAVKAIKLGTGRTGAAVEQHWGFMMLHDKLDEEQALAQAGLPTASAGAAAAAAAAAAPAAGVPAVTLGGVVGKQTAGAGSRTALAVWKDDMT